MSVSQKSSQSCRRLHRYMKYVDALGSSFHRRKLLLSHGNPMILDDQTFTERYRLPKNVVMEIFDIVREKLTSNNGSLSVEIQVLTALRFYASGSFAAVLSDECLAGLGEAVVRRCVTAVTEALQEWSRQQLRFPCTRDRMDIIKEQFRERSGFPNVLGVIGCTNVAIACPNSEAAYVYLNAKGFYSINVQMICDPELYINNVFAKFPGSCDDVYIWSNSKLRDELSTGNLQDCGWLVGGDSYLAEPWLMTPIAKPNDEHERAFNTSLRATTAVMANCLAMLRARFRCLDAAHCEALPFDPLRCCKVVMVVCALHNICLALDLPVPTTTAAATIDRPLESNGVSDDAVLEDDSAHETEGNIAREIVVTTYF